MGIYNSIIYILFNYVYIYNSIIYNIYIYIMMLAYFYKDKILEQEWEEYNVKV